MINDDYTPERLTSAVDDYLETLAFFGLRLYRPKPSNKSDKMVNKRVDVKEFEECMCAMMPAKDLYFFLVLQMKRFSVALSSPSMRKKMLQEICIDRLLSAEKEVKRTTGS